MSRVSGGLWRKFIAVQIYGANTDVGKTVFSTLLGKRFIVGRVNDKKYRVQYIKPVSTGPQDDRDDALVRPFFCYPNSPNKSQLREVTHGLSTRTNTVSVPKSCQSSYRSSRRGSTTVGYCKSSRIIFENFADNGSRAMMMSTFVSARSSVIVHGYFKQS
jgi:hypothetical protein